jgi:hypothetical protein
VSATAWPTLPEVRKFLRITGTDDDPVIDAARAAATAHCNRRLNYKWDPTVTPWATPLPDDAYMAAMILAAREYRRRDSIDGTVGWADIGLTHIGRMDPDVEALLAGIGPMVFG